jgi:glutamate-1-semialdehyde aminotransferase
MEKDINKLQESYLETLIARHTERTKASKKFAQTYRPVITSTGGVLDFNFPSKEVYYPIVLSHSKGSRVWDVDGNEYIDFLIGGGVNFFGYNPPFIKEALEEQLEKGIQIGFQSELAGEVGELICELTGMERVAFSNTGTEAVMTAIRLARKVTGRNKIVKFSSSYHGHFDGTLAKVQVVDGSLHTVPSAPGVLSNFVRDVLVLDYGDFQSLDAIKAHKQELAAVLVEPVPSRRPDLQPKEFLRQLRQLTEELGIALIFDEMVTGFRIHPGGAQVWFGVEADIATYGKIVGGGMPIGIIAGKALYMDAIDGGMWNYGDDSYPQVETTWFGGTFRRHPIALAAARAVLKHLKRQGPVLQQQLNQHTSQLVGELNTYLENKELPIRMTTFSSWFTPTFVESSASSKHADPSQFVALLYYNLLGRGIHLGSPIYLSTAHTDADISYFAQAFEDSVEEMRRGFLFPS